MAEMMSQMGAMKDRVRVGQEARQKAEDEKKHVELQAELEVKPLNDKIFDSQQLQRPHVRR